MNLPAHSEPLWRRATALMIASAIAFVLIMVAGFAPLSARSALVLFIAALVVGGLGMIIQHRRNTGGSSDE